MASRADKRRGGSHGVDERQCNQPADTRADHARAPHDTPAPAAGDTSRSEPYQGNRPFGQGVSSRGWKVGSPEGFMASLPGWMPCTDNLCHGHVLAPRRVALQRRYLRPNTDRLCRWLFVDIDREDAALAYDEANVAVPNVIVLNPANGHAHYGYCLGIPVITSDKARHEPIMFLQGISRVLTRRLGADPGFRNYLVKNPLHPDWHTVWLQPYCYRLNDLAVWLEPEDMAFLSASRETEFAQAGRNCLLTSELSKFGLRTAWRYRDSGWTLEAYQRVLRERAFDLNAVFDEPLGFGEVMGIVRSVGKWAWRLSTAEKFSQIQRWRALTRRRLNEHVLAEIPHLEELSGAEVAQILGCSRRNARRYHATPRHQYEANSLSRKQPWEAMGISRSTWYRRKKAGLL